MRRKAARTRRIWSRNSWRSTCGTRREGVFDVTILERASGFAALRVEGDGARAAFAEEAGGHRWQRIPPNDRRGRVQTSTITVAVMREPTEVEVILEPRDLEWKTSRGSGAGGQHRNKTESAVDLVHRPSGIVVHCESERSQNDNKRFALARLRARLHDRLHAAAAAAAATARREQVGQGMRGDKRRTIRCQEGVVVDHVTGRSWRLREYLRGDL